MNNDDEQFATMATDISELGALLNKDRNTAQPSPEAASDPENEEFATMAMDMSAIFGDKAPEQRSNPQLESTLAATAADIMAEEENRAIRTGYAVETEAMDHASLGLAPQDNKPHARAQAPQALPTLKADQSMLGGSASPADDKKFLMIAGIALGVILLIAIIVVATT